MAENDNAVSDQAGLKAAKESWFTSKRMFAVLYGLILILFGTAGFINYGYVGHFIAYCFVYAFGVFGLVGLGAVILLGLFMVIKGRFPHLKVSLVGLGFILLFLFGSLASCLGVENLSLTQSGPMFATAMEKIVKSPFTIAALSDASLVGGGFIGYAVAGLFLTGLGKIGAYIFCYLFLLAAAILILRLPAVEIYFYLRDAFAHHAALKKAPAAEEENKPAVKKEEAASVAPNPFKSADYSQIKEVNVDKVNVGTLAPASQKKPAEETLNRQDPPGAAYKPLRKEEKVTLEGAEEIPSPFGPSPFKEDGSSSSAASSSYKPEPVNAPSPVQAAPAPVASPKPESKPAPSYQPSAFSPAVDLTPKEDKHDAVFASAPTSNRPHNDEQVTLEAPENEPSIIKQPDEPILRYPQPSINLLTKRDDVDKLEINKQAAEEKIPVIDGVYQKLGVGAKVTSYTIGPSVTRFNISREPGVKVSAISSNDVQSEMQIDLKGDMSVRLEAVVKGQDTSGVEIGNPAPTMVSFRDCFAQVMKNDLYNKDKLLVPLGEDISKEVVTISLDSLPHLLVSGTTGSGKSVFIHSLIMTLIMRNYPDELKLVLVDPKKVEFTRYYDIPHLFCPVVTDITYAVAMMKRLQAEMERRYSVLSRFYCSDVHDYAKKRQQNPEMENMPNIVVIIDEFADIMSKDPKNVDAYTQSLAQKARSAGIYLIIATQRPTTDCITGTIKANIPARVALCLPTLTDSRTILDEGGAEKLLGKGDLLARVPALKATVRLQSAFVSNEECSAVCDYLRKQGKPSYNKDFINFEVDENGNAAVGGEFSSDGNLPGLDDQLYPQTKNLILTGQVNPSTSSLQRRLGIGYSRAASLIDALVSEGILRKNGNRNEVVHSGSDDTDINTGEN